MPGIDAIGIFVTDLPWGLGQRLGNGSLRLAVLRLEMSRCIPPVVDGDRKRRRAFGAYGVEAGGHHE